MQKCEKFTKFQQQNGKMVANEIKTNEKSDNESKRIRISGEPKSDLRNIGEMKIQTAIDWTRILVHNEGLKIRPVNSIREVNFTQDIHRLMKVHYRETYKSQAYAW